MTAPVDPELNRSPGPVRFVLASASSARLDVLRGAGLDPEVVVSGVDEEMIGADSVAELTHRLAEHKAWVVSERLPLDGRPTLVLGCDSLFEFDGRTEGKPGTESIARQRWHAHRGGSGMLHTGHSLVLITPDGQRQYRGGVGTSVVHFDDVTDAEIDAYVATGEPLWVAGGFTLEGKAAGFIRGVEGSPANVLGVNVAMVRAMAGDLGVFWPDLWSR